jgi:hypothetical protein
MFCKYIEHCLNVTASHKHYQTTSNDPLNGRFHCLSVFEFESSLYLLNGELECYGYAYPVFSREVRNRITI